MPNEPLVQLNLRLSPELLARIDAAVAREDNRSRNYVIVKALEQTFKEEK